MLYSDRRLDNCDQTWKSRGIIFRPYWMGELLRIQQTGLKTQLDAGTL